MEISCNGKWLLKSYVFDEHMRVVVDRLALFCVGSGEYHGEAANVLVVLNAPPSVVPTLRDLRRRELLFSLEEFARDVNRAG